MCIYGDGRVSLCVGNVKKDSIKELEKKILEQFPCHNRSKFNGSCLYRP